MRGCKKTWWLSTFGRVEACERDLACPEGHGHDRPYQRLSGVACWSKSAALQRALTDFGAEKSFAQASQQEAILVAGDSDFIPAMSVPKSEGVLMRLYHGEKPHSGLWQELDERIQITQALIDSVRRQPRFSI